MHDAREHDACMYRNLHFHAKYEYEYVILDPDACVYDAGMKYEYIYDH